MKGRVSNPYQDGEDFTGVVKQLLCVSVAETRIDVLTDVTVYSVVLLVT
jgi:hypothetical protein